MTSGQHLNSASSYSTRDCADRRSLSATCQCAQQSAESSATAHHFGSALVGAKSAAASRANVGGVDQVPAAIHAHRVKIEDNAAAAKFSAFIDTADQQCGFGSTWHQIGRA